MMNDNIEFSDRAIILNNSILVFSDLHLGYSESSIFGNGMKEYNEIKDQIESLVTQFDVDIGVIAGDIFHEFSYPPNEAINTYLDILNIINKKCDHSITIPGNHDTGVNWKKEKYGWVEDQYDTEGISILHGHETPTKDSELYVCGHLHPMFEIQGSRWPCYLYGESTYNNSDVLILPPFNKRLRGTPIRPNMKFSVDIPLLETGRSINNYKPIVYDHENEATKQFPRIGDMNEYMR